MAENILDLVAETEIMTVKMTAKETDENQKKEKTTAQTTNSPTLMQKKQKESNNLC